jgi:hypothetical protein
MAQTAVASGVSVVVATARQDETMDACTKAVARAAARVPDPVELIIVDDRNVSPEARRPAREVLDGLLIRRLWSADAGVSGQPDARNLGVVAASYDVLALTDDDARPDARWLEFGVRRLRSDPSLAGVEGAIRLDRNQQIDPIASRLVVNEQGGACINASMFYRTAIYRAVGGARPMWMWPPTNYREDTDLAMRVRRDGGPIAFEPDAFVVHPAEPISLRRTASLGRAFMADAMLRRLHPGVFGSVRRHPLARLRIRLATALTLAVPGLLGHRTRRSATVLIGLLAAAVSAHFEVEIRLAGVPRGPLATMRDTLLRLPRALIWALAAGSGRIQSEIMVASGLVKLPPERPKPLD